MLFYTGRGIGFPAGSAWGFKGYWTVFYLEATFKFMTSGSCSTSFWEFENLLLTWGSNLSTLGTTGFSCGVSSFCYFGTILPVCGSGLVFMATSYFLDPANKLFLELAVGVKASTFGSGFSCTCCSVLMFYLRVGDSSIRRPRLIVSRCASTFNTSTILSA